MTKTYVLRRKYWIFFTLFCLFSHAAFSASIKGNIEYCFTPGENCTQKIIDVIDHAQKTLWIQAYQFTSLPISDAVIAAKRRGVDVKIILDKTQYSQKHYSSALVFSQAGIPVWIDKRVSIAHNKVIIADNHELVSGSFNFSKGAQIRNAENVLLIESPELANAYAENWKNRQAASMTLENYIALKNSNKKSSCACL